MKIGYKQHPPSSHMSSYDPFGIDFSTYTWETAESDDLKYLIRLMTDQSHSDVTILTPPQYTTSVEIDETIVTFYPDGNYSFRPKNRDWSFASLWNSMIDKIS